MRSGLGATVLRHVLIVVLAAVAGTDALHFDLSSLASSSSSSFASSAGSSSSGNGHQSRRSGLEYYSPQLFHEHRVTNITTQIGTHTFLPCKARQLANKSVSWIRVRDDHILTVDRVTFIADERFQAFLVDNTGLWTLQIKYVQAKDAGLYECQVSTEPKVSARVHLHVVVPRTELIGEPSRYVKAGSRVVIRCVIRGALEPPSYIIWYFGAEQIFQHNQYGWKMQTDEGDSHSTIASLLIPVAKKRDSGNYTCNPSNSDAITVVLHVINGENSVSAVKSSATQHDVITPHFYLAATITMAGCYALFT